MTTELDTWHADSPYTIQVKFEGQCCM